jgi:hypothetical protein
MTYETFINSLPDNARIVIDSGMPSNQGITKEEYLKRFTGMVGNPKAHHLNGCQLTIYFS